MFADYTFDPIRYALLNQEYTGSCSAEDLPALKGYLHSQQGVIDYKVKGYTNVNNAPVLEVEVKGQLELICQRCLGGLLTDLSSATRLVLVKDEKLLPEVEDEIEGEDVIVAPQSLSLLHLVEEELLLALPLTTLHDSEQCHASESELEGEGKTNPFQVLTQLKR
ncbi:MAG: DUF177 domain-containing protein [Betaproteobacteria bacterium]|nr:DUF177 domain-containing protein [Betaproteobacteria bacterium]